MDYSTVRGTHCRVEQVAQRAPHLLLRLKVAPGGGDVALVVFGAAAHKSAVIEREQQHTKAKEQEQCEGQHTRSPVEFATGQWCSLAHRLGLVSRVTEAPGLELNQRRPVRQKQTHSSIPLFFRQSTMGRGVGCGAVRTSARDKPSTARACPPRICGANSANARAVLRAR